MEFGVFYTCFTEINAVDYSIEILKSVYPNVPIYLVSDGGSDYSFLEKKYTNIKTNLEYDSRSFIPKLGDNFKEFEIQKQIKKSILTFLDRTNRAIDYCNKEYLLVMEPDILVRGKISNPSNAKLLGSRINKGLSNELKDILKKYEKGIPIDVWGATPVIFHSETFKIAYENLLKNDELLNELCKSEKRLSNYDILYPVLFATIGIEETSNPEIVECFRNYNWETSSHPLVHQYRAKYPLKKDGYNGTHANHINGMGDTWHWKR